MAICPSVARCLFLGVIVVASAMDVHGEPATEDSITLSVVLEHDDGKFLWYHPRAAAIPTKANDAPLIVMTLQKHLYTSDHYSGLYSLISTDLGQSWEGPTEIPELAWKEESDETVAVCDVTPAWHAPSHRMLAIGVKVRYGAHGNQLLDKPGSHQVAYAAFDPKTRKWTGWHWLELPDMEGRFFLAMAGCSQWVVDPDGSILIPIYHKGAQGEAFSATVIRTVFDGTTMTLRELGSTMELAEVRGLCEPSLVKVGSTYYLTLRNDLKGYVTRSSDGLNYEPIRPWTFDDGEPLGSYNTQQHWLVQEDRLYLVYTRPNGTNDHIIRHRAPLYIAEVDTKSLHVLRATERILIPERGGEMGNFGVASIRKGEAWATVGEGIWNDDARRRGAKGAVFIAKVRWPGP